MNTDLRSWIEAVETSGELKHLDGADWNIPLRGKFPQGRRIERGVQKQIREKWAGILDL